MDNSPCRSILANLCFIVCVRQSACAATGGKSDFCPLLRDGKWYIIFPTEVQEVARIFQAIDTLTRAGLHANEDAVWAQEDFLFVIDGATGLSGRTYMDPQSDARWFSQRTAQLLRELLPHQDASLRALLHQAMDVLRHEWQGPEENAPTAAIAIWRCRNDELELLQLGDCGASAETAAGTFITWQETALTRLDAIALQKMQEYCRSTGCSMAEARQWVTPLLQKHRALHNQPGGYWTLDPSGAGIDHARTAQLLLSDFRSVCVWSDGYGQLCQFMPQWDAAALHRESLRQGVDTLAALLYEKQEEDSEMLRVPRFKLRDDTSAITARIAEEGKV